MTKKKFIKVTSPAGEALFAALIAPDTHFATEANPCGQYKVNLVLNPEDSSEASDFVTKNQGTQRKRS